MSQRNVSRRGLETAADRAKLNPEGVPRLSMHDLRHTYVSHLIRAGFDVVTVQRLAGPLGRPSRSTSTQVTSRSATGTLSLRIGSPQPGSAQ
jgi:site-specific recombinase XerD